MKKLEEKIQTIGEVRDGNVLKVDSFLNHQVDPELMDDMAVAFMEYFKDKKVTKIVTIETSGIAPSLFLAKRLGVPMVFMKKGVSTTLCKDALCTEVFSFTKNRTYSLYADASFFNEDDHVLLIDDFLANGEACVGALRLLEKTKVTIEGIGIVIEKSFQPGRSRLEEMGHDICSLARIQAFEDGQVVFQKADQ